VNDWSTQADRDNNAEQEHDYAAGSTGRRPPPVCTYTMQQNLEHNAKTARHKSAANNKSHGIVSLKRISEAHAVTGTPK
jgi:hypothetical protein